MAYRLRLIRPLLAGFALVLTACGTTDGDDPEAPTGACAGVVCDPPQPGHCEEGVMVVHTGGTCDAADGACRYVEARYEVDECGFGFNFGFESWAEGVPTGFFRFPEDAFEVLEETASVNTGASAARLESEADGARDLTASLRLEPVVEGERYTFHVWHQFSGGDGARLVPRIEVADPVGQASEEWQVAGEAITGSVSSWREAAVTTPPLTADRSSLAPSLRLEGAGDATVWARTDDWAITVPVSRRLDGTGRDLDSRVLGFSGSRWVAAGIDNAGVLYVAANAAEPEEDLDRIVFVWTDEVGEDLVEAPFGKAGRVAGPSADQALFALKQTVGGGCAWAVHDGTGWSTAGEADCGDRSGQPVGAGYVAEGTIDLVSHLADIEVAAEVPASLSFAAAGFEAGDGGGLDATTQMPRSLDDDGDVDPGETVTRHRATFLSGRVH